MIGFFDRVSRNREHGWAPFVWLVYSGFFFVQPIMDHVGRKQWLLDLLGFFVFLLLYAGLFVLQHPRGLLHIAGMVALGMIFIPWNGGASTFFIFAAAFTPFVMETQTKAIVMRVAAQDLAGRSTKIKVHPAFFEGRQAELPWSQLALAPRRPILVSI